MKGKCKIPADVPAAACGRCYWFKLDRPDGWGKCALLKSSHFYKSFVCEEYELDTDLVLAGPVSTMEGGRS